MARPQIRSSLDGIELSLDLFDLDRTNPDGTPFLVVGEILPEQVEWWWNRYLSTLKKETT